MACRYLFSEEVREYSENGSSMTFGGTQYSCIYDGACPFVHNEDVKCPVKCHVGRKMVQDGDPLSILLKKKQRRTS